MSTHSFCPACGNLLLVDTSGDRTQLKCRACNFVMGFVGRTVQSAPLNPLDVKALITNDDAMSFQNKTQARCDKCGHNEAFFTEIQIRSADEPATLFFKCCKCGNTWREG
ncbi:hypothetical protein TVAG_482170 [Trichomonas vaginalis G3]|uniref:DNA-directed RNA polymerase subunit n=1 Tax=Trichomonas vaginalis (strain ATCC PRA-98 / G3) TaxID=412133 RepID=A2EBM6_TRIV3|nr:termination of RNA polymerase III transcription [Trichomonas vaginalis G3]EAY09943.1 hypothetical protein TVAG_482170 [Trichomonas vaginalis G3]KAI5523084.1 termination of RNA polymerase III transcription [Trichomonas vaginalis G3]|eukprot:XP_001322166.1 hypothetical protein [Trichomonas vaginalis G3]